MNTFRKQKIVKVTHSDINKNNNHCNLANIKVEKHSFMISQFEKRRFELLKHFPNFEK